MDKVYCPNCGKEMKSGYIYVCKDCKIKYNSVSEKYTIPKNIVQDITDKQKRCIGIICSNLKIDKPYIISKFLASKFISNNIEKSKNIREENRYEYEDYDYYGFGEDYY